MSVRLREYYDWAVVGDDVGALLSAALVARLGLSVLILGPHSSATPKLSKSAQRWEPESNLLFGLGASGLLTRCLAQLGLSQQELDQFRLLDPAFGLRTAKTTWVLPRSLKGVSQEIEREGGARYFTWPSEDQLVAASNRSIDHWKTHPERLTLAEQKGASPRLNPSRGSAERALSGLGAIASTRAEIRSWAESHPRPEVRSEFSDFVRGMASAAGASSEIEVSEWWALLALLPTLGQIAGGMPSLRKFLTSVAIRNGAHQNERADLKRIFVSHGRLVGVQVSQLAQPVRVAGVILGADFGEFTPLLDTSGRNLFGSTRAVRVPDGWKIGFSAKFPSRFLSEFDAKRWVISEHADEVLELEWVGDEPVMMVRSRMPWTPESLSSEAMIERLKRMHVRLLAEFPLLKREDLELYPNFLDDSRSAERVREVFPYGELSQIPSNLRVHEQAGITEVTGIEGLFVSSGEVRSELGSFGKIVTAVQSAAWIAHRSGVAGPFG